MGPHWGLLLEAKSGRVDCRGTAAPVQYECRGAQLQAAGSAAGAARGCDPNPSPTSVARRPRDGAGRPGLWGPHSNSSSL